MLKAALDLDLVLAGPTKEDCQSALPDVTRDLPSIQVVLSLRCASLRACHFAGPWVPWLLCAL